MYSAVSEKESTAVEVVAPATLAEGFEFEAVYQGTTYTVRVPRGGVIKGQRFNTPLPPGLAFSGDVASAESPEGFWKDGLFECCKFGCCHASFIMACCCSPLLFAQIMTRLNLNWYGSPGSPEEVKYTFMYIAIILIITTMVIPILFPPTIATASNGLPMSPPDGTPVMEFSLFASCAYVLFFWFIILIGTRTRAAVRRRYNIPATSCGDLEDCCCLLFCQCCTASQLARETADYETTRAELCSDTGLESAAPIMIV